MVETRVLMPEEAEPTAEDQLADMQAIFDLRWDADMRAIRRWQAATGRDFTWPDHADLVVWLLEQLTKAEARLAKAGLVSDEEFLQCSS